MKVREWKAGDTVLYKGSRFVVSSVIAEYDALWLVGPVFAPIDECTVVDEREGEE